MSNLFPGGGPVIKETEPGSISTQETQIQENPIKTEEQRQASSGEAIYGCSYKKFENTQMDSSQIDLLMSYERNANIGLNEIQHRLEDPCEREKNKERAKDLFYAPKYIKKLILDKSGNSDESKINLDLFNSSNWQEDLDEILGNFVTNIEGKTLEDIYNTGEEKSKIIHKALNMAFEFQILKVLKGKGNYPKEKIQERIGKMKKGNPFEKLQCFEEIKELVNTKEGALGRKQSVAFEKSKKIQLQFKKLQQQFANLKQESINEGFNPKKLHQLFEQTKSFKQENKIIGGEVFHTGGELDVMLQEIQDILKEHDPLANFSF